MKCQIVIINNPNPKFCAIYYFWENNDQSDFFLEQSQEEIAGTNWNCSSYIYIKKKKKGFTTVYPKLFNCAKLLIESREHTHFWKNKKNLRTVELRSRRDVF